MLNPSGSADANDLITASSAALVTFHFFQCIFNGKNTGGVWGGGGRQKKFVCFFFGFRLIVVSSLSFNGQCAPL